MREQIDPEHSIFCPVCSLKTEVEPSKSWKKEVILTVASLVTLISGYVLETSFALYIESQLLFILVVVLSGREVIFSGLKEAVIKRRFNIHILITVAAVGAFLIGHGIEGASIVFLFSIAENLEEYTGERVKRSIADLLKLAPDVATVRRKGREVRVHAHNVAAGEVLLIRPGEKIPLDGVVIRGSSSVNQAPITGESLPVPKDVGDELYAGTINNEGYLEIKVTREYGETLLSKIVNFVEEARRKSSPAERFVEKFSRWYTPTVIALAVLVAVIPTLLLGMPFQEWIYRALVLLVVSCPCALAISTPIAMVSAITNGARNGILIKGGAYVEEVGKAKVFAFDKTGTLTEGKFEVTDVITLSDPKIDVLSIASSLEKFSEHPLAKALLEKAEAEEKQLVPVEKFEAVPGKGIRGQIDGKLYSVGNTKIFHDLKIEVPEDIITKLENEGKTVILVGSVEGLVGIIAFRDKIRKDAPGCIRDLKEMGIHVEMLTGDNERTAKAIAASLGIDHYHAGLLPQDKVEIIEKHLSEIDDRVVAVGDGVNDAPALAAAKVGVAMGVIGSDIALETADVALMEDDLSKIPYLVKLGRKALSIVRQNIVSSILIKGSLAFLVFPGFVTLWMAVALGDMGLSLAVILNAMRLILPKIKGSVR